MRVEQMYSGVTVVLVMSTMHQWCHCCISGITVVSVV